MPSQVTTAAARTGALRPHEEVHGVVLAYFTTEEESLHLAVSVDGVTFTGVDGGAPQLASAVGSRRLRDPFIGRTAEGVFHLLATDGWRSRHIVHASSVDLTSWTEPELVPVMAEVPGAMNAWAPEFFLDDSGVAHLIWSSVVAPAVDAHATDPWADPTEPQRIWTASTRDFVTFGPSRLFFDPGYSVIDATVVRDPIAGGFLMAFKDERGSNELGTAHKDIRLARFTTLLDEPAVIGRVPASPVEGPTIFLRDGAWVTLFDHFLEGRYGAMASEDGVTWAPTEIHLPQGVRHASVLPLDRVDHLLARI